MHPTLPTTIEVDTIFGRIEALEGDMITRQLLTFGAHTRPELAFFLSVVEPGDAIFDIGAHVGTFALPLAHRVGTTGTVLAVEGSPVIHDVLRRNIERNGVADRVRTLCAVVGTARQRYVFTPNDGNSGASYFAAGGAATGTEGISLDRLVADFFVPRVVKLDIEGMELVALRDAPRLLAARPAIYMEVAQGQFARYGIAIAEASAFLSGHGYRFFRNVGNRNARDDAFTVAPLAALTDGGQFFDVLALHAADERLARFAAAASPQPAP